MRGRREKVLNLGANNTEGRYSAHLLPKRKGVERRRTAWVWTTKWGRGTVGGHRRVGRGPTLSRFSNGEVGQPPPQKEWRVEEREIFPPPPAPFSGKKIVSPYFPSFPVISGRCIVGSKIGHMARWQSKVASWTHPPHQPKASTQWRTAGAIVFHTQRSHRKNVVVEGKVHMTANDYNSFMIFTASARRMSMEFMRC